MHNKMKTNATFAIRENLQVKSGQGFDHTKMDLRKKVGIYIFCRILKVDDNKISTELFKNSYQNCK